MSEETVARGDAASRRRSSQENIAVEEDVARGGHRWRRLRQRRSSLERIVVGGEIVTEEIVVA